jgi:hypothetical protein
MHRENFASGKSYNLGCVSDINFKTFKILCPYLKNAPSYPMPNGESIRLNPHGLLYRCYIHCIGYMGN